MELISQPGGGLRAVLLFAAFVNIFFWGAQGLMASQRVADLWGITLPENPVYVRIIGAFALAMGVLYYYAARDPERHRLIVKVAILKNAILTVILFIAMMGMGIATYLSLSAFILGFWGLNLVLCAFFTIALWLLFPSERTV